MDNLPFGPQIGDAEHLGCPSGAPPNLRRKVAGLDAGPRAGENRREFDHVGPLADFAVTAGSQVRPASWGGNGTVDVSQLAPTLFALAAGPHALQLAVGRSAVIKARSSWHSQGAHTRPAVRR